MTFKKTSLHLPFYTVQTLKDRLEWLINSRWLVVFGILASVPIGQHIFHFDLGYKQIMILGFILLVVNMIHFFSLHFSNFQTEFQEIMFAEIMVLIDLIIISCLVHYSGGVDNPFYFFYMIVVILGVFLFPGLTIPLMNALFAALLLTGWTVLEFTGRVERFQVGEDVLSTAHVLTALFAFYIMTFAGIYIITTFVDNYRKLKEIIDQKNEELEVSLKEKAELFRYASHELKSPITTIQSTLAVVNSSTYCQDLSPQVRDMVERAERRSNQLLDMVNEMIEITKYKQGIKIQDYACVQFCAWLKQTVELQQSYAIKKDITLDVASLDKEIIICFDRGEMDKVLRNLVSNALRYTTEGGRVSVEPFQDNGHYGFCVADTGIGIAKKDQKKIFNEFYRTPEAKKMERRGTGLGLNLVREIIEKHGGTIKLVSAPGKGSQFTVRLPVEQK